MDEHIAAIPYRIEGASGKSNVEDEVAEITIEPPPLRHYPEPVPDQRLGNICPVVHEFGRGHSDNLNNEIEILIGASGQPSCEWSHIDRLGTKHDMCSVLL